MVSKLTNNNSKQERAIGAKRGKTREQQVTVGFGCCFWLVKLTACALSLVGAVDTSCMMIEAIF